MGQLHDTLEFGGYSGHRLERFPVRILFCLFAEDTGIFERETFRLYVVNRTAEDGSDLGLHLPRLFDVLNTPADKRQKNLDETLAGFPYANGALEEFISGDMRWCLWLKDASPPDLRGLPRVRDRIERVRAFRAASSAAPTQKASQTPSLFFYLSQPTSDFVLVPEVSSEKRRYIPMGFVSKDIISANTHFIVPTSSLRLFGVLTSLMNMA
jgi:hypothetical protein